MVHAHKKEEDLQ